jgi:hypothetical protein
MATKKKVPVRKIKYTTVMVEKKVSEKLHKLSKLVPGKKYEILERLIDSELSRVANV